ncbi:ribosomal biogenesis protein LAS1L-like [Watersipora subatra]|uniref:ribosomal biogenesis protein LAS1L-like n=1 Tax=Watersipora subatra TaxID=2589382 RepID=UPI00355C1EE3
MEPCNGSVVKALAYGQMVSSLRHLKTIDGVRSEFERVADLIISDETSDLREAQERLLVWRVRQGRRFQDVLDITLCILTDLLQLRNGDAVSSVDQQAVTNSASLTIARFVNLMTEGSLADKLDKTSVAELAAKIGIPEWLVSVRHEIVHRRLPSTAFATSALLFARGYVHEKFWSLSTNRPGDTSAAVLKGRIRDALRDASVSAADRREILLQFLSQKR